MKAHLQTKRTYYWFLHCNMNKDSKQNRTKTKQYINILKVPNCSVTNIVFCNFNNVKIKHSITDG